MSTPAAPATPADVSGTITTGNVWQVISPIIPPFGFGIYNPDPVNDLWITLFGQIPSANGQGSIRVAANGGAWETPPSFKHKYPVNVIGAVTGQIYTAQMS